MRASTFIVRVVPLLLLLPIFTGCRQGMIGCGEKSADVLHPANEAATAGHLRSIQSAQNAFIARHDHYACTMSELGSQFGLIDRQLSYGEKDGYSYTIVCSSKNGYPSYDVWATPTDTGVLAPSTYCIDQGGKMNHSTRRLDHCSEGRAVE
jgi:putative hemolysin